MNTDAGTEGSPKASLSAELERAAALLEAHKTQASAVLKRHGLTEHSAGKLLAPEATTEKPKKKVRAIKAASAKKVKAASAKKAATATKREKATSGQSGPTIKGLKIEDLNKKERLLLGCFELKGEREVRSIDALGAEAFKSQTVKRQNSWARNSLRRLVRSDPAWLEKTEPGQYRLTTYARAALNG